MEEHTLNEVYSLLASVADGQRQIREQLDRIEQQLGSVSERVSGVETRLDAIEFAQSSIVQRQIHNNQRLTRIEGHLGI